MKLSSSSSVSGKQLKLKQSPSTLHLANSICSNPMHRSRDANPHFFSSEHPQLQDQQTQPPPHEDQTSEIQHGSIPPTPTQQQRPSQPTPHPITQHSNQRSRSRDRHPSTLRVPTTRRTNPIAWLVAAFCALFWIIIIVGGLAVLIIYLVYRPQSPKFEVANASLSAAYLDMGYLLNADITFLANFTNPNRKVSVDFSYVVMGLYFEGNLLATRVVDPFSAMSGQSKFAVVLFITSQLRLSLAQSQELQKEMDSGRVKFQIKGVFRARSRLGGILRYSYWLYTHCDILVTSPPNGVLIGHKCVTKR